LPQPKHAPQTTCSRGESPSKLPYWAYPHIIESILSYATDSTLRAAADTCRGLRKYAKQRLRAHIVLGGAIHSPDRRPVPHLPLRHPEFEPPPTFDLATIRIVDARMGERDVRTPLAILIRRLPNLHLLRIHHGRWVVPSQLRRLDAPVSVVHFIDLGIFTSVVIHPEGVGGDVFLNLRYTGSLPDEPRWFSPAVPDGVTVYILMSVGEAQGGPFLSPEEAWRRLLTAVASISYCHMRVVVVGDGSEAEVQWVKANAPQFPPDSPYPNPPHSASITAMSFAALKAKLGENTFDLIMEP
jgi:hypothetical protein